MTQFTPDLALAGAGYWGKNLARNFHALGALHTLCDRSDQILDSYGDDYSTVRKTASFEEVLADVSVTKVAIAAPAALHFRLAKEALLQGKDVYVEKPLCLDIAEAEELVKVADSSGRILMVGHLLQYHPCVTEIQRLVSVGEVGKIQYITSNRLNLGKIRQEENSLWSFAPHDISVILSLVGGQLPEQVSCTGGYYLTPGVADTTLTTFKFSDSVRAHVYVSWLNPFKEQKLTVVGSRGMIVFDDTKPWGEKLQMHRDYLTWTAGRNPTPNKAEAAFIQLPQQEPLREECLHFLECCENRSIPRTDGREGLRVGSSRNLVVENTRRHRGCNWGSPPAGLRVAAFPSAPLRARRNPA
jgi:UDP-2-acetamido-3-amino-2,3-dideoxy-glucuronate N-acetyltransferase